MILYQVLLLLNTVFYYIRPLKRATVLLPYTSKNTGSWPRVNVNGKSSHSMSFSEEFFPGIIENIDLDHQDEIKLVGVGYDWTASEWTEYSGLASIIYVAYSMDMLSEVKMILDKVSTKVQDAGEFFHIDYLLPFTRDLMSPFQKYLLEVLRSSQVQQFAHKVINSYILKFRPTKPTSSPWIRGFKECSIQQCSWCKPLQEFLVDRIEQETTIWMSNRENDKGHLQHLYDRIFYDEISHSTEYSGDESVVLSLWKVSALPNAVYRKCNKAFHGVQFEIRALDRESLELLLGEQRESVLQLNPIESEIPSAAQSSASSASNGRSLRLRGQTNTPACSSGSNGGAATSSTGQDDVSGVPGALDKISPETQRTSSKRASESDISDLRDDATLTGSRGKRARRNQN
ncbi:hypothetical protein BCON_0773g00030 [Botryotinia convoluta]|uniref:Uncharacterized protein n=1 Tax=Botryotinia convoluta TaxID=54673 RepID=A0A4Z1H3V1_9HELO|nr:hypothetical protein BCON_0773g00030 [Botryotinia convoluta]